MLIRSILEESVQKFGEVKAVKWLNRKEVLEKSYSEMMKNVISTRKGLLAEGFEGKHIDNPNTHGTGCTLSSAIAANLAKGYDLPISVERAKDYISGALSAMLDLGAGSGPMDHGFAITGKYVQ